MEGKYDVEMDVIARDKYKKYHFENKNIEIYENLLSILRILNNNHIKRVSLECKKTGKNQDVEDSIFDIIFLRLINNFESANVLLEKGYVKTTHDIIRSVFENLCFQYFLITASDDDKKIILKLNQGVELRGTDLSYYKSKRYFSNGYMRGILYDGESTLNDFYSIISGLVHPSIKSCSMIHAYYEDQYDDSFNTLYSFILPCLLLFIEKYNYEFETDDKLKSLELINIYEQTTDSMFYLIPDKNKDNLRFKDHNEIYDFLND